MPLPPREEERTRVLAYRIRVLPGQLDAARRRYESLVREAKELGMTDILKSHELET